MDDVRRGVGTGRRLAPLHIDRRDRRLLCAHLTRGDDALVNDPSVACRHGVDDVNRPGVRSDLSLITDLTTALGVERRTLEEDPNPLALLRRIQLGVVLAQEEAHRRFRLVFPVPDELGRRNRSGL